MVEEVERESKTQQQSDVSITNETPKQSLKKVMTWKSPELDFVLEVWLKNFPSLHFFFVRQLQSCLDKGSVPEYMTKGLTVLIRQGPKKGAAAENYFPITCLPA